MFGDSQCSIGTNALIWQRDVGIIEFSKDDKEMNKRNMNAVEMRSLLRICGVSLIESAMKRYTEWQVLAMAKKIYDEKMTGKRGERHRLAFENTVSKILEEGHVKSMWTPQSGRGKERIHGMHEEVDDSGQGERGM